MTVIDLGVKVATKFEIEIPQDVVDIIARLQHAIPDPTTEYGVYLQGEFDMDELVVRVKPGRVYLPEQIVSAATISFLEEPPSAEWNVVVHRHPHGCNRFSSTDRESINREFIASAIFIPNGGGFPDAIVNLQFGKGFGTKKLQVPASVTIKNGKKLTIEMEERAQTKVHRSSLPEAYGYGADSGGGYGGGIVRGGRRSHHIQGGRPLTGIEALDAGEDLDDDQAQEFLQHELALELGHGAGGRGVYPFRGHGRHPLDAMPQLSEEEHGEAALIGR